MPRRAGVGFTDLVSGTTGTSGTEAVVRRLRLYRVLILVLSGVLVLTWAIVTWQVAAQDAAADDRELADAGAAAEEQARVLLEDLTTYSFRDPDETFDWLDRVADGSLRERVERQAPAARRAIRVAEQRAEGHVVDAAYRAVDPGRVVVLAFVDRTVRDARHRGADVQELRVGVTLVEVDGQWQIEALDLSGGALTG